MERQIQQGYFVIADISGYTRFVAEHDLEHAQGVLHDLLTLIMERLTAPFHFVELEGDAVFVYAAEQGVTDSEHLLDIVEACYAAFRMRVEQMAKNTTCTCSACKAMPMLDLKCVAHFGRFALQKTPTGRQLVGPDVTLTHILLKNKVIEKTGIKSYGLITDAFLRKSPAMMEANSSGVPKLISYDSLIEPFGQVSAWVMDISVAVERYKQRFRDNLDAASLDMEVLTPMDAPAAIVWNYIFDPVKRPLWQEDVRSVHNLAAENGRTDIGWEGHCDHGAYLMKHRIVDWKPVERITMHSSSTGWTPIKPPPCQVDFIFENQSAIGCTLRFQVRLRNAGIWNRIIFKLFMPLIRKEWSAHFDRLRKFSAEEFQACSTLAD